MQKEKSSFYHKCKCINNRVQFLNPNLKRESIITDTRFIQGNVFRINFF